MKVIVSLGCAGGDGWMECMLCIKTSPGRCAACQARADVAQQMVPMGRPQRHGSRASRPLGRGREPLGRRNGGEEAGWGGSEALCGTKSEPPASRCYFSASCLRNTCL